ALRTAGTAAEHSVDLETRAAGLSLEAHGHGRYAAGDWHGQFERAQFSDGGALQLSLESPAGMSLSADRLQLEEFCLHAAAARLCAQAQLDDTQRRFALTATSLPLRT